MKRALFKKLTNVDVGQHPALAGTGYKIFDRSNYFMVAVKSVNKGKGEGGAVISDRGAALCGLGGRPHDFVTSSTEQFPERPLDCTLRYLIVDIDLMQGLWFD